MNYHSNESPLWLNVEPKLGWRWLSLLQPRFGVFTDASSRSYMGSCHNIGVDGLSIDVSNRARVSAGFPGDTVMLISVDDIIATGEIWRYCFELGLSFHNSLLSMYNLSRFDLLLILNLIIWEFYILALVHPLLDDCFQAPIIWFQSRIRHLSFNQLKKDSDSLI